jgi:hypothetical protein
MRYVALIRLLVATSLLWTLATITKAAEPNSSAVAPKPLFRDPVHDGAADPVIVWNPTRERWWMFYTNRRANMRELPGVSWVHGTRIGIAESTDGANWKYVGTSKLPVGGEDDTHWAPDIVHDGQTWHMFLTFVPGIHNDWSGTRHIHHLASPDLVQWTDAGRLPLPSERVLDASVLRLADGTWRLWYNDETRGKTIFFADSPDLTTWKLRGQAIREKGEGPKAFRWNDKYWLIVDEWEKGQSVWSSDDAENWKRQRTTLLLEPGTGTDDLVHGGHADVVVAAERAYLYYFTHPDRRRDVEDGNPNRSSIQVVELMLDDNGQMTCDRNEPTTVVLVPPSK